MQYTYKHMKHIVCTCAHEYKREAGISEEALLEAFIEIDMNVYERAQYIYYSVQWSIYSTTIYI